MRRYMKLMIGVGVVSALAVSSAALAFGDPRHLWSPWRDCSAGYVALTFDDGPNPDLTPALLTELRRLQVRATFFVLGSKVITTPAIVRREAAEGHSVESHSWDHPDFTAIPLPQAIGQLSDTANAITTIGLPRPGFYRPPYNRTNPAIRIAAQRLGFTEVGLTVDSDDWEDPGVAAIVSNTLTAKAGGIVNMHDTHEQTAAAMPAIVAGLKAKRMCPGRLAATTSRNLDAPSYLEFYAKAARW